VALLAACAAPAPSPGATDGGSGGTGNGGNGGAPGTSLTACELVTPTDIEAALGLDAGTAQPGEVRELEGEDPAANECSYLAQSWGGLVVAVNPTIGAGVFDDTVAALGDRAETLDIGDGAVWVEDIERGYFLQGPVLITISVTRLVDPVPFREPTIVLGEAAVDRL
jgi:hypothetical protein